MAHVAAAPGRRQVDCRGVGHLQPTNGRQWRGRSHAPTAPVAGKDGWGCV